VGPRVTARISVITATLNRRDLLRRAIDSVVAQGLEGVEHIIVDGVSTDGTLEMLAEYPHLVVISEPDDGLYQAWNKGIRRATGDLICILNSDDEIPPGAFARAREAVAARPDLELLSGAAEVHHTLADGSEEIRLIDSADIISLREQEVVAGHTLTNARYLRSQLVRRVGLFDERYRLVSDRDYLLRVRLATPRHVTLREPLYRFHVHDGSLTFAERGVAIELARECFEAARHGLITTHTGAGHQAYAKWHAWAAFYLAGLEARQGRLGASFRTTTEALTLDPAWLARVPAVLWRHIIERAARRGRLLDCAKTPRRN